MKRKYWLLLLVFAVLLNGTPLLAASDFYVIAAGGSGVGTKITSVPYTINSSGFYYLTGDLTYSGPNSAITVNANNVTIDLMGFTLIQAGDLGAKGIYMVDRNNVEVRNGTVSSFGYNIIESGSGVNHRILNVRALNTKGGWSIQLNGDNHLVQGCSISNNYSGIIIGSGIIANCVVCSNTDTGIQLLGTGSVIGNIANSNISKGFNLGTGNIVVDRNSASGNGTNYAGGPSNTAYWGINAGR